MKQKNKGGRPKSSRVQRKSRAVTVRYSALQYDIIRHRARTAGFRTLTEGALPDFLPQVLNLITHLHKEMKRQKVL